MGHIKEILKGKLVAKIFDTKDEMGKAAGNNETLAEQVI